MQKHCLCSNDSLIYVRTAASESHTVTSLYIQYDQPVSESCTRAYST